MADTANLQSEPKYGKKTRHSYGNLYRHTLPLAAIFVLDILPSRCSLMMVGHLTSSPVASDAVFMAYCFTNWWSVWVLSLSCGLDTLSRSQLENLWYLRYALCLVAAGLLPYALCVGFSGSILTALNTAPELIAETSSGIAVLTGYAVCYIVFAMLRKSLLQYLHTALLIGFMFARLCIHLMTGYALYRYTEWGPHSFLLADSLSMAALLAVTVVTLSQQMKASGQFVANLCCGTGAGNAQRAIMNADAGRSDRAEHDTMIPPHGVSGSGGGGTQYLREYVAATMVPGAISCLEWWAVEAFSFLVNGLVLSDGVASKLTVLLTHSVWTSFLLLFQMPMLGMSVAMAAIITADIRSGRFYPAWYTFVQSMASVIAYCVGIALVVLLANDKVIYLFFPIDALGPRFEEEMIANSASIRVLLVLAVCGYSMAMCFLGIFVSVGRLARGGTFMLIGYYAFGLILAVILGFVAEWKFYGVWFGFAGAFLVWCLLSAAYWMCTDWFMEMDTMKAAYDVAERKEEERHSRIRPPTYGATQ